MFIGKAGEELNLDRQTGSGGIDAGVDIGADLQGN